MSTTAERKIETDLEETPASKPSRWQRTNHWVLRLLVIVGSAAALAWVLTWWQERPLAEAEQAWRAGDYPTTLKLAEYFLDSHPEHGRAKLIKARALTKLGDMPQAAELFSQVGAATTEDTHLWGEALLAMGRYTEALPLLNHVVQVQPQNADALYEITTCRMRLHQHREALSTADRFARMPNCEARGRVLTATIQYDMKNYEQAVADCRRVHELEPDGEHLQIPPHDFFIFYGRALLDAGRPREALPILGRSVLWQATPEAYTYLGEAAKQVGELKRASSFWQSALKLDANYVPAREALANQAITEGNGTAALEWLAPLEKSPDMHASTAYLLQRAHVLLKNQEVAARWQKQTDALRKREKLLATVDRVALETPDSFWALIIRAYRFAEAGNWTQAAAVLRACPAEAAEQPFVKDLIAAVETRGALPPIEQLPIKQF